MPFKKQLRKLEVPNGTYFITFVTWERLELTPEARKVVLDSTLYFHTERYQLFAAVIMPDHVHLLLQPFRLSESEYWSIGSLLHSIKGFSSKQIPKVMKHIGKVWQDGRHDELIKNQEHFINSWEYIRQNPVKAYLSATPQEYPFLWENIE